MFCMFVELKGPPPSQSLTFSVNLDFFLTQSRLELNSQWLQKQALRDAFSKTVKMQKSPFISFHGRHMKDPNRMMLDINFGFFGIYRNGKPDGDVWVGMKGGGYLHGWLVVTSLVVNLRNPCIGISGGVLVKFNLDSRHSKERNTVMGKPNLSPYTIRLFHTMRLSPS